MGKILNYLLIGLLSGLLLFTGSKVLQVQNELKATRAELTTKLEEGNLALGRANTKLANAESMLSLLDAQTKKDIADRNAKIDMYASLVAKYQARGSGKLIIMPGSGDGSLTLCDKPNEPLTTLPFEYQDFRLKFHGDIVKSTFEYTLSQRFELQFAETKLPSGGYNQYASLYELDEDGKRVGKLELTKFDVIRSSDAAKPHFQWWNPRLDFGIGMLLTNHFVVNPTGSIGISLMGYGTSKSDISWRFLKLNMDLNKDTIGLSIAPAVYNIAKPIPLLDNLYIGPSIGRSLNNYNYILLGLSATL